MGKMTRKHRMRASNFNGKLSQLGYGRIDGKMRHDRTYGRGDLAHNNEFPPIRINRRVYATEVKRTSPTTRRRVDYNTPGPLYIHRWLRPAPDCVAPEVSLKWKPRDFIDVDPHLWLKTQKYPRDELMLNPYLRFPIYHRLPLHYRLMMEEEVVSYDNIVNNKGTKMPQEEGEWCIWNEYRRDQVNGRVYNKMPFVVRKQQEDRRRNEIGMSPLGVLDPDAFGTQPRDLYRFPVRVNRQHIPYEFPRGKNDWRFYHPMKGGRSENIPGRKDASTEFNYARDSLEEMWGGEGVIRGHTFLSKQPEIPQRSVQYNATWWPERRYNHKFTSMLLGEVIQTVATESCLDQVDAAGGFDEYILYTSPARLMSDLACRLKKEMLQTLNRPQQLHDNIKDISDAYGKHVDPEAMALHYMEKFEDVRMSEDAITWINLPIYEALKRQLALEMHERNSQSEQQESNTHWDLNNASSADASVRTLRMEEIVANLNRERFGAAFELQHALDDYGEEDVAKMVNSIDPKLEQYRRKFPELRDHVTLKYAQYSAPTKQWSG